ncbi:MAG: hypothetical protein ACI8P3_003289 [Saprospiraceae bacterium]|jgi:hypothetical protein
MVNRNACIKSIVFRSVPTAFEILEELSEKDEVHLSPSYNFQCILSKKKSKRNIIR